MLLIVRIEFFMKNERIEKAILSGDYFEISESGALLDGMLGKTISEIAESSSQFKIENYIYGMLSTHLSELLKS